STGRIAAAPQSRLRVGGSGTLLFLPIYASGVTPSEHEMPTGILAFRFFISPTIDAIVDALEPLPEDLEMYVLDDGASAGDRVICYPAAHGPVGGETQPDEKKGLSDPIYGSSLSFAGRDWTLVLRPTSGYIAAALGGDGNTELAAGLVVTLLLCAYLV